MTAMERLLFQLVRDLSLASSLLMEAPTKEDGNLEVIDSKGRVYWDTGVKPSSVSAERMG